MKWTQSAACSKYVKEHILLQWHAAATSPNRSNDIPWPSDRHTESRERILFGAERLFTEKGFDQVSIDQVMQEAGMTRGAFYRHFDIRRYLSPEHLAQENGGCPLAFLVSDTGQRDQQARESYTRIFTALASRVSARPNTAPDAAALRSVVMMIGGVAVARALSDPALATQVLEACCQAVLAERAGAVLQAEQQQSSRTE
ncbi:TetR/AcrR family transcriptional regulator [Zobellella sp. DQSA1]|uniref:TetR/AcrR family transcriptional regulator n=1 Tax=Zobellella sp. DQSA1 TaxID=3342386 RepID=UPI0035BF65A6